MSFKVTDFGTNRKLICDFLLVINSNLPPILHRFHRFFWGGGVGDAVQRSFLRRLSPDYHRLSPFLFACLLLSGDIELNTGPVNFTVCTLNIRSILHPLHSAALSDLNVSHHPDLFCLTETWIKNSTTCTELTDCTPPNYTFLSTPRTSSKGNSSAVGGGTGFLIREPFLSISMSQFSSFEHSSVTLKLPQYKISFFNIYRPPSSSSFSKPFFS